MGKSPFYLSLFTVAVIVCMAISPSAIARSGILRSRYMYQSPAPTPIMIAEPVPYAAICGSKITVAVLDSGIDIGHKDLAGKIVASVNFTESSTELDVLGHGTHVAGIIASDQDGGALNEAHGINLLNVKVVNDNGMVWPSDVAKGIFWAVDNGAQIINMSFTDPIDSEAVKGAVEYAANHGVIMLAAAGNHVNSRTYPAAYPDVIAVAAIDSDNATLTDNISEERIDIYAPGRDIYSTVPGNKYAYKSGSSFATAEASHAAALILEETGCINDPGTSIKVRDGLKAIYPTMDSNITK
ncbi:MAG: S8 family serine peptidase [Syntrophales bacterium]|nr:S8 family serine peptidase [Syntrophales bacterium]